MYYHINEHSFQGETRLTVSFRCKDKINAETLDCDVAAFIKGIPE